MKKLSLIFIALCACATFHCERDTNREKEWPRDIEPRLSNAEEWTPCRTVAPIPGRVVQQSQCQTSTPPAEQPCYQIEDAGTARHALSFWPKCLDRAIAVLKDEAPRNAAITSDYAAALYLRAQRDDRAEDLLEAFTQVRIAVAADPTPAARFNHALLLEALGAREAAIAAWTEFLAVADGGWRKEATTRLNRLRSRVSDVERWERAQPALAAALRARDSKKVDEIIAPFPSAAVRHFEEELSLQWAETATEESLAHLRVFAGALLRRLGDRLPVETVEAIERAKSSPEKWSALREGHRLYALARLAMRMSQPAPSYKDIEALLMKGDSPFRLAARVRNGEPIAAELRTQNYRYYAAIAHWQTARDLQHTRFIESRDQWEEAREIFKSLRDWEGLTAIHGRLVGLYRQFGIRREEWRQALYAQRHVDHLIDSRYQTTHYLELAAAARRWKQYDLARFYLDQHVSQLRTARSPNLVLLAFALAHRAQAALDAGSVVVAQRDLDELEEVQEPVDIHDVIRVGLAARKAEVRGRVLLEQKNARGAIDLFTTAIQNTDGEFATLQASLLTRRAEAYLAANQEPAARADLETAVDVLQREGKSVLEQTSAEDVLNPYFDRFQSTYRELVRLYMEHGDFAGAFAYAELARAAEPLNLVGRRPTNVPELLTKLPPRTYLLEYCVLERETYYWLIGDGQIRARRSVPRATIERWRDDFHRALNSSRIDDLRVALAAAYEQLIAPALQHIPPDSQIVIVPDGALYALPFAAMHSGEKYLVQTAVLEYSGSAALYLEALENDAKIPPNAHPTVLAVGNPTFDPSLFAARDLRRLFEAAKEAHEIAVLYSQDDPLIGKDATVPEFWSRAPGHDVIHIAAHAVVNPDVPARSAILFAPSPGHSGALEPQELQQLRLPKTRLMVLPACETGGGLPIGSEGVAPLLRPTLAAGVPGVVATLWKVNDTATTRKFMVSLHVQYKAGRDAATALRDAQVEAIDKNTSVKDWAAFQVIGHASSPFAPRPPDSGGKSIGIHSSHSLQRSDGLRSQ